MSGLNEILLVGACIAFVAAVATFALVRERDFVDSGAREVAQDQPEPVAAAA